jgi:para-nitrobenzyl esterase
MVSRNFARTLVCAVCTVVSYAGMAGESLIVGASEKNSPHVVATMQGSYQGYAADGGIAFKGMRYATPPVGSLRWQSPKPAGPHKGVTKADSFGPACLQSVRAGRAAPPMSEDCLTLNVWTPGVDDRKRPVMVWIHGGGFRGGSGNGSPGVFVANDVVFVSLNYRLGPLGFFSHEALGSRHANFGMQDMVLALEWVQDNIARFGGDADRVTIFGVSAGGMAVNLLMVAEASEGLFHRAIAQSGYGTWPLLRARGAAEAAPTDLFLEPAMRAETHASELVAGITDRVPTAEVLRELDGRKLVSALKGFQLPIVDGTSLREEPGILFLKGLQHRVPYMSGGNSFEGSVMPGSGITAEDMTRVWQAQMAEISQLYKVDYDTLPSLALTRLFGDQRYLQSARVLAGAMASVSTNSWLYYIDYVAEAQRGKQPGTGHGTDAYLLLSGAGAPDPVTNALSRRMVAYWVNFARSADPNGDGSLTWPIYDRGSDQWMVFGAEDAARSDVIAARLDLLESRYLRRVGPALKAPESN